MTRLKHKLSDHLWFPDDDSDNTDHHSCHVESCEDLAKHKAPIGFLEGTIQYKEFCKIHAREVNAKWNFCNLASAKDMDKEKHFIKYGVYDSSRTNHEAMSQEQINISINEFLQSISFNHNSHSSSFIYDSLNTEQKRAYKTLGLEPPVTVADVKKRYKQLAKKYHPDILHNKYKDSPERLKEQTKMFNKITDNYRIIIHSLSVLNTT